MSSGCLFFEGWECGSYELATAPGVVHSFVKQDGTTPSLLTRGAARNGSKYAWRCGNHYLGWPQAGLVVLADDSSDTWWLHFDWTPKEINTDDEWSLIQNVAAWANTVFVLGYSEDGLGNTYLKIWECDYATPSSPAFTAVATGTTAVSQDTEYRIDVQVIENDGGAGQHSMYVKLDGVAEVSEVNNSNITGVGHSWAIAQWSITAGGKGGTTSNDYDNWIQTEEGPTAYDVMEGECSGSTWGVAAGLFDQDISGYGADWTTEVADTETKGGDTSGTADAAVTTTNGTPGTLTDTRVSWTTDMYVGSTVSCNGKTMAVASNTGDTITGTGAWSGGDPGQGNSWSIAYGGLLTTTGPPGTLTDGRQAWATNEWANMICSCNGKTMTIASNTPTVLTGTAGWSGGGNPGNFNDYTITEDTSRQMYSYIDDYWADNNPGQKTYLQATEANRMKELGFEVKAHGSGSLYGVILIGELRLSDDTGDATDALGVYSFTDGANHSKAWSASEASGETSAIFHRFLQQAGTELEPPFAYGHKADWTRTIYNTLQVRFAHNADTHAGSPSVRLYQFYTQVVGTGLTAPTDNATPDNADATSITPRRVNVT